MTCVKPQFLNRILARERVANLRSLMGAYENWQHVVLARLFNGNASVVLKDYPNARLHAHWRDLVGFASLSHHGWKIESFGRGSVLLRNQTNLSIWCRTSKGGDLAALNSIFVDKVFGDNLKGKTVLDVGTGNGDSSIFFASNGARFVVGVEPFSESFDLSNINIRLNSLTERIRCVPWAISGFTGNGFLFVHEARFDGNRLLSPDDAVSTNSPAQAVRTFTLRDFMKVLGIEWFDFVKLDCEGAEYSILRAALTDGVLHTKIGELVVEFHHGVQNLAKILQREGFETTIRFDAGPNTGYIAARRDNWAKVPSVA